MARIENSHLLEDVFGYFPSFHDAEVLRIVLDRETTGVLPTLEVKIYVFEMTSEVKDGKYVFTKHSLATFQFLEVEELQLEGFNHQNALQGLFIKDVSEHQIEVSMDGVYGVDVQFQCASVKVLQVEPFSN